MKKIHLIALNILLLVGIIFFIIQFVQASPSNPGHPASEIGGTELSDRTFQNNTYAFPNMVSIGTTTAPTVSLYVVGDISAPNNTLSNCAWTTADCEYSQTCPSGKIMVGVERDPSITPFCGSAPNYWYYMSIHCCNL